MNYKEFLIYCKKQQIEPTAIDVYLVDVRLSHESILLKRNIQAEKVRLVEAAQFPHRSRYYLANHFAQKYNQEDKLIKHYLSIYDNVRQANQDTKSVEIFLTKEEAQKELVKQISFVDSRLAIEIEKIEKQRKNLKNQSEQIVEREAEIPLEYNVKIGDYVKITENADGHPVGTVGFVIDVEEVPEGYYNHVVVSDCDDNCWNEYNVKLVHRAMLTCEDENDSEPSSVVTPATEEDKMVMCDDEIVSHTGSVYHVHDIDTSIPPLTYCISVKKESSWFSDTELVNYYAKLLEDGRVYDWATDTTFANVESWIDSTKRVN